MQLFTYKSTNLLFHSDYLGTLSLATGWNSCTGVVNVVPKWTHDQATLEWWNQLCQLPCLLINRFCSGGRYGKLLSILYKTSCEHPLERHRIRCKGLKVSLLVGLLLGLVLFCSDHCAFGTILVLWDVSLSIADIYIYVMCCLFVSECWASGRCNNDDIITNYSTNCWMYFVFIDLQLQFVITSVKLSDNRSPQKPHRKATPRFLHEPRRLLHGLPCSIPISYCSFSTTLRSWSTTRTKELLFLSALSTK